MSLIVYRMNAQERKVAATGVFLIVILWLIVECNQWWSGRESFTVLREPGSYPAAVTSPILYGSYPVSDTYPDPIQKQSMHDLSMYDPDLTAPMSSYEQVTNNYRYWSNPENGTAQDPALSGCSFYGEKTITPELSACSPGWSDDQVRINYYSTGSELGYPGRLDM
jgi:hypothetical protein